jgi:hypothetical protein
MPQRKCCDSFWSIRKPDELLSVPDTPTTILTLLRNGWIERRATKDGVEYRITEVCLTELSRPR